LNSDLQSIEVQSVSTQIDLTEQTEKIDVSTQTDQTNLALIPYNKVVII